MLACPNRIMKDDADGIVCRKRRRGGGRRLRRRCQGRNLRRWDTYMVPANHGSNLVAVGGGEAGAPPPRRRGSHTVADNVQTPAHPPARYVRLGDTVTVERGGRASRDTPSAPIGIIHASIKAHKVCHVILKIIARRDISTIFGHMLVTEPHRVRERQQKCTPRSRIDTLGIAYAGTNACNVLPALASSRRRSRELSHSCTITAPREMTWRHVLSVRGKVTDGIANLCHTIYQ